MDHSLGADNLGAGTGNTMNKLASGAIVGTLGVALLLGGAGTFAMWNGSSTVAASTVTSGVLTIVNSGTASWKNVSTDLAAGGVAIPTIASYKIVPGDVLEMTQLVTVGATGDNLAATLTYDATSIVAPTGANAALNTALKAATTVALVASGTGVTPGTANTFNVLPNGTGTSTVTVKLTITFPSSVSGATAQGGQLDLSAVKLNLVQNTRP